VGEYAGRHAQVQSGSIAADSMNSACIIAIAGPPGSGKTTLAAETAKHLPQIAMLFLDGFETPANRLSSAELTLWLAGTRQFDDFNIPGLSDVLAALKAGRPAREPVSGRKVDPAPLVLFEMPFGRAYGPTAGMIDFLVWLDTPLDVALARNVLAWEKETPPPPRAWFSRYMSEYLAVTRAVLEAQRAAVSPGADLVLDGLAAPHLAAQKLLDALKARHLVEGIG
jgi:uridine kinase